MWSDISHQSTTAGVEDNVRAAIDMEEQDPSRDSNEARSASHCRRDGAARHRAIRVLAPLVAWKRRNVGNGDHLRRTPMTPGDKKRALCEGQYVGEAQSPIAHVRVCAKSADLFRHLRGAGPAGVRA